MVERYVSAIRTLLANRSRTDEIRARGVAAVRERFAEATVTARLLRYFDRPAPPAAMELVRRSLRERAPLRDPRRRAVALRKLAQQSRDPRQQGVRSPVAELPYFPGEPRARSCGHSW